jgi:excisionase family DNA binding protein
MEREAKNEEGGTIARGLEKSAEAIGVSTPTLKRILGEGGIPYAQVRRRIVILDSDLRAYLARNRKTSGGREAA